MQDRVAMLLSSDWFFPYWGLIGIRIEDDKNKESIQHGCRRIVEHFMSRATEYWHISFSPLRVKETRVMFEALLRATFLPKDTIDLLLALVASEEHGEAEGSRVDVVMFALTERLRTVTPDADSVYLSPDVRDIVARISAKYETEINWEQLCLRSATTWDRYLREVTPDQPTYLADFLVAEVLTKSFQGLWAEIKAGLNANQEQELVNWYRVSAKSIMGVDLPSFQVN